MILLEMRRNSFHRDHVATFCAALSSLWKNAKRTLLRAAESFATDCGAKSTERVVHVRPKRVSISRTRDGRARRPTPAFDDFSIAKPRTAIFAIREVHLKTGKRQESRRRPFPNVAQHLSTTVRAISRTQSTDINRTSKVST